jgi:single-strand DNA-binding protein
MRGINKVILVGNLGKDPEVRRLDSGSMVATFSLATTEVYNDKNGNRQEQTEWHNIAVWGKQAEIAEKYLKKGSSVYVEGRIRSREYTDKNTNQQKRFYEIICDRFTMLDRKTEGGMSSSSAHPASVNSDVSSAIDEPVDDLPF